VSANRDTSYVAAALQASFASDVGAAGVFLPERAPASELPVAVQPYLDLCAELPDRYSAGGVRSWLEAALPPFGPEGEETVRRLGAPEADTLMTALSALAHTFRWDAVPPAQERFHEARVELPGALAVPWRGLARRFDVPCVGSAWSLHLTNWRADGIPGGARYEPEVLRMERLGLMVQWLPPPYDEQLRHFSLIFVLTEARGAAVVSGCVRAVVTAERQDSDAVGRALEEVGAGLEAARREMTSYLRAPHVEPDDWLEMVQPTMPWGAVTEDGEVSGPNGLQVPTIQCADAALGVGGSSLLASSSAEARRYMPPGHRRFLSVMDRSAPVLRDFVRRSNDDGLRWIYNDCLKALRSWRIVHQKRGAQYLRGSTGAQTRVSTGLGIPTRAGEGGHSSAIRSSPGDHDAVEFFESTMARRVSETVDAMLPGRPREGEAAYEEEAFSLLDAQQRRRLLASGAAAHFSPGAAILVEGKRDQPLAVIDSGTARVSFGDGRPGPSVRPGEVVGEVSFLDEGPASASVVAVEAVEATLLERGAVRAVLAADPELAAALYRSLGALVARRLRRRERLGLPE
jgi:CRP-like cAMP-binding protein